jgi:hypothetical protein
MQCSSHSRRSMIGSSLRARSQESSKARPTYSSSAPNLVGSRCLGILLVGLIHALSLLLALSQTGRQIVTERLIKWRIKCEMPSCERRVSEFLGVMERCPEIVNQIRADGRLFGGEEA